MPPPPAPLRRRRNGLLALAIALPVLLVLGLAVGVAALATSGKSVSDGPGRVTLSVPRTWSDETTPEAGQELDEDGKTFVVPDVEVGNFLGDRYAMVYVEPRDVGLAETHQADVDDLCHHRACVDRGRPAAVEVNGRRGYEQVLAHAGAEWTILLTLESDRYVVSLTGYADDFADEGDVAPLRTILRSVVITD